MRRGPLAESYPGAVALVVCSLVPYLILVVAILPLGPAISASLGVPLSILQVAVSLSAGAYAVGTVLAIQFASRFPPRRLLVGYEAAFVTASVLAAWAPNAPVFAAAFIVQGLLTSLMLIAAVPPLVTAWPAAKMPISAGILNLCIFGAVAAGPSLGALQAAVGHWRALFWGVAAIAGAAFLLSVLTFRDEPAQDRSAPWDVVALGVAFVGCVSAFFGAGVLQARMTASPLALVPLVVGVALIVFLVIYEYRLPNPLIPVKALATSVPVAGIFVALAASAAAFGVMGLLLSFLHRASTPTAAALIFLPEFVAAGAVAVLFGALLRTRYLPVLAGIGVLLIVVAALLVVITLPGTGTTLAVATGLVGLGVGASVSPALFIAGLSLRSRLLQRVFALIELLRGVTAFLVSPILAFVAGSLGQESGIEVGILVCLGLAAAGFLGGSFLYLSGRPRLEAPDLERWHESAEPAWESPPLFSALRRAGRAEPDR
ncbi:MFS transporter [Rhizomonospora bruguierae]|uniref:MFS transporter n=1 Tax=Rhizomonospora bruguierae TaxID=1581705 RepID=UPI001BCADB20|nr:MFS transporter [Micromonospora sp. NBRC 107566]